MCYIGIIPTTKKIDNNHPYDYYYKFINDYITRLDENGACAIGILLNDTKINYDSLKICDAFLFPGGNKIERYHYEIIEYAINNHKPILGICLGMQAISSYLLLYNEATKNKINPTIDNLFLIRNNLKKKNINILEKIKTNYHGGDLSNGKLEENLENIYKSKHDITINKKSELYKIYKKKKISVISMHQYKVNSKIKLAKVSSKSSDNTVESIEYLDNHNWIVGVQFHPELLNDPIWNYFVNIVKQKKSLI